MNLGGKSIAFLVGGLVLSWTSISAQIDGISPGQAFGHGAGEWSKASNLEGLYSTASQLSGGAVPALPASILITFCVTREDRKKPQTLRSLYDHRRGKIIYDREVWCANAGSKLGDALAFILHEQVHCTQTSGQTHTGYEYRQHTLDDYSMFDDSSTTDTQRLATMIATLEIDVLEAEAEVGAMIGLFSGLDDGNLSPGEVGPAIVRAKNSLNARVRSFDTGYSIACQYDDGTATADVELAAYKAKLRSRILSAKITAETF